MMERSLLMTHRNTFGRRRLLLLQHYWHHSSSFSSSSSSSSSSLEKDLCDRAILSLSHIRSKKKHEKAQRRAREGATALHNYFCKVYGKERWESIGKALLEPSGMAALLNVFADGSAANNNNDGMASEKNKNNNHELLQWLEGKNMLDTEDDTKDDSTNANDDHRHPVDESSIRRVEWAKPFEAYWMNEGKTFFEPPSRFLPFLSPFHDDNKEAETTALFDYYCLDPASLLPVMALNLHKPGITTTPEDEDKQNNPQPQPQPFSILDMCAAPGGKTLSILHALFLSGNLHDRGGSIVVSNDVSRDRRRRLRHVLDNYIPPDILRSSIIVNGRDGVAFGSIATTLSATMDHTSGTSRNLTATDFLEQVLPSDDSSTAILPFSHVLCDAPCSGERHILQDGRALGSWKASKKNQKRQIALLKAAIAACREGGTVVYSTCSIDPEENDTVVDKLLSKRDDLVDLLDLEFPVGERTKNGWIILPDHPSCIGIGPLYIAAFRRR